MDRPPPDDISKSERKRRHQALQRLGRELAGLSPRELERIPLEESVLDAVREASRLERAALQRQLRYLGQKLAASDPVPIQAALDELRAGHVQATARLHRIERWRDRLIAEGDGALAELLSSHPHANRTELRNLVRQARRERGSTAGTRGSRELFRHLRTLEDEAARQEADAADGDTADCDRQSE